MDNEDEGESTEGPKQSKQREEKQHTKEKLAEIRGKKPMIWDGTKGRAERSTATDFQLV